MSCEPVQKCNDPTINLEDCPKDQIVKATNPKCTDAHQGSDANNVRGCDSNMIASYDKGHEIDKKGSSAYKKMRAYQLSQNCISMGKATRTGGIRGGYNREAIAMADIRGSENDGRGKDDGKTTFTYPGTLGTSTAENAESGYSHEANRYIGGKKMQNKDDKLRQPDFKTLKDFNQNLNGVRKEVTDAALLKDPECGPLANSLQCTKQCDSLGRNDCLRLSAQCAFKEGLTCTDVVWRGQACYNKNGDDVLCTLDPCEGDETESCVAKRMYYDEIVPIDDDGSDDERGVVGLCAKYGPAMKEGKPVVEGITPYTRKFDTVCYNKAGDKVDDCDDESVTISALEPVITEECKNANGTSTDCRKTGMSASAYNDDVDQVIISNGDPFYNTKLKRGKDKFFVSSRVDTEETTGSCDFLELEQLNTAYKCCKGTNKFAAVTDYFETKSGLPLSTGKKKEKVGATEDTGTDQFRAVQLQSF